MNGICKFFNSEKKFGFVTANEVDYFFHESNLVEPIKKGDSVTFTEKKGKKGMEATQIKRA